MRARRTPLVLAVVFGLLLAAFASRLVIAEAVLTRQLSGLGLAPVELKVTALDLDSLTLEDLRLTDRLSAERLIADFDLLPVLLDGRIDRIAVDGARLRLDLTGDGPLLVALQALAGGSGTEGESLSKPTLALRDAIVVAETPVGIVEATFEGTATPGSEGLYEAALRYEVTAPLGHLAGTFDLGLSDGGTIDGSAAIETGTIRIDSFGLRADAISGRLRVEAGPEGIRTLSGTLATQALEGDRDEMPAYSRSEAQAPFDAKVRFEIRDLATAGSGPANDLTAAPAVDLEARILVHDLARLELPSHPAIPQEGNGRMSLSLSGSLAPITAARLGLRDWLLGAALDGSAHLDLTNPSSRNDDRDLAIDLAASLRDETLSLRIAGKPPLAVPIPALELAASEGTPTALADLLGGGWLLILPNEEEFVVSIRPEAAGYAGEITASPVVAAFARGRAEITGRLRFALAGDFSMTAARAEKVSVMLHDLVLGGDLAVGPIEASGALTMEGARIGLSGWRIEASGLELAEASVATAKVTGSVLIAGDQVELQELSVELAQVQRQGFSAEQVRLEGALSGSRETIAGLVELTAGGSWRLPDGTQIRGARLAAPLRLAADAESLSMSLEGPASLKVRSLGRPESAMPLGVSLQLSEGRVRLPWGDPAGAGYSLTLRPLTGGGDWPWQITLLPDADEPLDLAATPGELRLEGGPDAIELTARFAEILAKDHDVAAREIVLDARLDPSGARADGKISVGTLQLPSLPTAKLEGALERRQEQVSFTGRLAGHPLWQAAPVTAGHDLATGGGEARLGPLALRFEPGGALAGALKPLLGGLAVTAGTADASATASWNEGHLASTGRLTIKDLSATSEDLTLNGLSADLLLDDLFAPSSPPDQAFTIARIQRPLEVTRVEGRLQIRPGRPPKLRLDGLRFDSNGARLRIDGALLDPGAESNALVLEVEQLDLEQLTQALAITGVSGSGSLAGRVPLALEGQRLVITDGLLESQGSGIVRYRTEDSLALLEAVVAGEGLDSVKLFDDPLRLTRLALTDFHYDSLTLRVANSADGQANLKLGLKGRNPALLSGYPFDLNVNLDTNLLPLLKAVDEGLLISRDLLPRSWRFGR